MIQDKKCLWCEKDFTPSSRNLHKKYCSIHCGRQFHWNINKEQEKMRMKEWYRNHRESEIEKNAQYRKENKELFDWYHNKTRFDGLRNIILDRDNKQCQICEDDGVVSKRILTIHHIDGKSYASGYKPEEANNEINNLITLCNSCHHKLHWWQRKNRQFKTREDIVRTMTKVLEARGKI